MSADSESSNHRRMIKADLGGRHTHSVSGGINVHIYQRQGRILARGRINRTAFGATLGDNEADAERALRHLLVDLESGAFVRPSEARKRPLRNRQVPRLSLRELSGEFLAEKRRLRGAATMQTYQSRLGPALDFFERRESVREWPLARDLNRDAIIQLRTKLMNRQVTRNGRPGAMPKLMSPRQVRNCLETLRSVLAWASRADVRKLPPEFVNPVTADLIGPQPAKNPLRQTPIPMAERVRIVKVMDAWQLLHLSVLTVLPLRFEDVSGALISDVDLQAGTLHLGSRFDGNDFTKGRTEVEMPLPAELIPVLVACIGDRSEGPLFRSRAVCDGRRRPDLTAAGRADVERLFHASLAAAPRDAIQTEQDRKRAFRRLLCRLGGVTEDQIGKELKPLLGAMTGVRPYDLRGSVTQDMKQAGIHQLELRYLTAHSVADILNAYTGLDPGGEMTKYFERVNPLLAAIHERAVQSNILPVAVRTAAAAAVNAESRREVAGQQAGAG